MYVRVHHEDAEVFNFLDFYFRVLNLLAKNAKFYTSRKFPAIRYYSAPMSSAINLVLLQGIAMYMAEQESKCMVYARLFLLMRD